MPATPSSRPPFLLTCAALVLGLACGAHAHALELLQGEYTDGEGVSGTFSLSGENREDPVGGTIQMTDDTYTIERVSRHGVIGARHANGLEFAVFSSSFSELTVSGQPYVAARRYLGCEQPYNSFIGIYSIEDSAAVGKLGKVPYGTLTDDVDSSAESIVYCFMSRPPG